MCCLGGAMPTRRQPQIVPIVGNLLATLDQPIRSVGTYHEQILVDIQVLSVSHPTSIPTEYLGLSIKNFSTIGHGLYLVCEKWLAISLYTSWTYVSS